MQPFNTVRSTPRTFVRLRADGGVEWILRPVYTAPRPGVASKPVTLREYAERKHGRKLEGSGK